VIADPPLPLPARPGALAGALAEIVRLGGGTVESYPEDAEGRSVAGAFLHNGTLAMFERQGFKRARKIGKHRWVVASTVEAGGGQEGGNSNSDSSVFRIQLQYEQTLI
jgi:hypothetical protein